MRKIISVYGSLLLMTVFQTGCATGVPSQKRVFLDSSSREDNPPEWVKSHRITWEKGGNVHLRASHTVRGNERVNGCFDLARLDAKEVLLSEISNDVRGTIDHSETSISENAEAVLGKARSSEFKGKLLGLRLTEQYFERYVVADTERVDCYVLIELTKADYDRIKRSVVDQVVLADPRIKEALLKKQVDFFSRSEQGEAGNRAPAQEVAPAIAGKVE